MQIGGSARASTNQRLFRTVTRFQVWRCASLPILQRFAYGSLKSKAG